jgi:hypothetical protein
MCHQFVHDVICEMLCELFTGTCLFVYHLLNLPMTMSMLQQIVLLSHVHLPQIIIARQSKESLYCEMPLTSIACSLYVLHASGGDTRTKGTTSHQNMSLNMHEAKYACIHGKDVQLL